MTGPKPSTTVAADLVEAFEELAAHLRGEVEVESYELCDPHPDATATCAVRHSPRWTSAS